MKNKYNDMMKKLKTFIKVRFPFLIPIRLYLLLGMKSPRQVFTRAYRTKVWGGDGVTSSISGPGSSLSETESIRKALPLTIKELHCRSFLDIPCGDFFWMKTVNLNVEYIGGDIVADMIEDNMTRYGGGNRKFICLDIIRDKLPRVDLIFCRDCLVHLSYSHIFRALKNIKNSGSAYLLTTTFVKKDKNKNIVTGNWRSINLQIPPFNFPPPIKLINEGIPHKGYQDKSLGLWKIVDIPKLD